MSRYEKGEEFSEKQRNRTNTAPCWKVYRPAGTPLCPLCRSLGLRHQHLGPLCPQWDGDNFGHVHKAECSPPFRAQLRFGFRQEHTRSSVLSGWWCIRELSGQSLPLGHRRKGKKKIRLISGFAFSADLRKELLGRTEFGMTPLEQRPFK